VTALLAAGLAVALGGWLAARRRLATEREQVARARHEVRGPLTALHLALHGLARRGELGPAALAALELEVRRAALALGDLPGEAAAAAAATRVDVAQLLDLQVATWAEVGRAQGADVRLRAPLGTAPAIVLGDAVRLAQAVGNLLANAIEHAGGTVEVRLRCTAGRVRIEVADDGPGLPAPVAELAAGPRGGRGGRGRGLGIAAAVAAAHGGRLTAAPSARGARLVLDVPAAAARPLAGAVGR
jgi:signal transduction histidine kinase